jgi:hypothetical protein
MPDHLHGRKPPKPSVDSKMHGRKPPKPPVSRGSHGRKPPKPAVSTGSHGRKPSAPQSQAGKSSSSASPAVIGLAWCLVLVPTAMILGPLIYIAWHS